MPIAFAQRPPIGQGETGEAGCDFSRRLKSGETLTGTPTATEIGTSDLTISAVAVNVASVEIDGESVDAELAVTFLVSGQKAGTTYQVRVEVDTTRGQHLVRDAFLPCV